MVDPDPGPSERPREQQQRDAAIQRVRVGLTGLAAVFLLTLLAASIFNLLGQDDPKGLKLANGTVITNIAQPEDPPKEPLAELGVAPGGAALKTPALTAVRPLPASAPVAHAAQAMPAPPPAQNQASPQAPAPAR